MAGIKDEELPSMVLRYCSERVRKGMKYEPEFDSTATDWEKVKERLRFYYSSSDERDRGSASRLRRFSERKRKVGSRHALDKYIQGFKAKAGNLVARKQITKEEQDILFYKGLPKCLRSEIKAPVEKAAGKPLTQMDPPKMAIVIGETQKHFSEEDVDYSSSSPSDSEEGDSEDDTSDTSSSSSSSESDDLEEEREKR
ncbi:uncharacterized protein LAESUDRAFT_760352 [Laetiporus sulphureus 93-53]|uniref:Retrotransposon gag domain-containing protein n=1 Tax=Laetiporus sulphureus 93-53 TaxID=1314785 RepID=A0A165DRM1_9APHY|nr:uncharacterized protein LAESUDRAFT_760352 [Laetiporus sulphureus 93-53]KZT05482.1 hypothetical protein LAESUDRAFT_760352 [Laetiporus sulphureus 93-53]